MATVATTVDRRRNDLRAYTHETPFWITSKLIDYQKDTGKTVALFDFPKGVWSIIDAGVEVVTAMTGGTPSVSIDAMTAAVQAFVDGATFTYSALGGYVPSADVTEGTAAFYPAATGTLVTSNGAGTSTIVVGATTTMPIVTATLAASGTAGAFRVHMLISRVPVQSA
jgi:hypothetical protein